MDDVLSAGPRNALPRIGLRLGFAALVAGLVMAYGAVPAAAQGEYTGPLFTPPENQNISGVWWIEEYSAGIEPVGGGDLPFTPEGLQMYEENMAVLRDGSRTDEARRICVPDGIPRILGNPYPFEIGQTHNQVTFVYELNHVIRALRLDAVMPNDEELEIFPAYSGYSVARWEGDTLIVTTAGFHWDTFIDATGIPHSPQLRTEERYRRLDADTLEAVVTVTDPEMFTQPWQARFTYELHPDVRIQDYSCGDGMHRDISHIPGVTEARQARQQQ